VIWHIGYIKNASTFLQRDIFPKLENVKYFTTDLKNINDKPVPNMINLFSHENMAGDMTHSTAKKGFEKLDKLKRNFPEAKILLIYRNKNRWVKSVYNQYVKEGGKYSFSKWFERVFDTEFLDYESMFSYLKNNFKQVLILPFELLIEDHKTFVEKLCKFIGAPVPEYKNVVRGRSLSRPMLAGVRLINHFNIKLNRPYRWIDQTLWRKKIG